jgi:hypothetical protein
MTTMTTLQNIEDAITAIKDGWASTALTILEEARLNEKARTQLMEADIYPPGTESVTPAQAAVYETIVQWDEGGGKRSRRELARRIVAVYTTAPAAQQCKWPTCQNEEYQQALAEQIKQELVTGTAPPQFPTALRKMWSGTEVQQWINQHWNSQQPIQRKSS